MEEADDEYKNMISTFDLTQLRDEMDLLNKEMGIASKKKEATMANEVKEFYEECQAEIAAKYIACCNSYSSLNGSI